MPDPFMDFELRDELASKAIHDLVNRCSTDRSVPAEVSTGIGDRAVVATRHAGFVGR